MWSMRLSSAPLLFVLVCLLPVHNSVFAKTPLIDIESDTFKQVYLIPDEQRSNIIALLVFPFGESHNPKVQGLVHYAEHLAWLNAIGRGDLPMHSNAWTNLHTTGYWLEFAVDELEQLQKLIKVSKPLTLSQSFMLEERDIIEREYEQRLAGRSFYDVHRDIAQSLLKGTGFERSVIGLRDEITTFDLAAAKDLHQQSHRLQDATLLLSGDINREQAMQWLQALVLPATDVATTQKLPQRIHLDELLDVAEMVTNTVPSDAYFYEKLIRYDKCQSVAQCNAVFDLLRHTMNSSIPGGLASALRYDQFIASSYSFDVHSIGVDGVVMRFQAVPDQGVDLAKLEIEFKKAWGLTIDKQLGLSEQSFERVRKRIISSLDKITDEAEHALDLAWEQLAVGLPVYSPGEQRAAYESITLEAVMDLLGELHEQKGREVVRYVTRSDR